MKFIIITITLVAAASFATSVQAERIVAVDPKSGAVHSPEGRTDKKYSDRDHEGKRTGENLSSEESSARKKGTAYQEKKPRLRYRDEPKCSC